jgi:hypothetical protein
MAGVVAVRLTRSPELAVAVTVRYEFTVWVGIGPKVMTWPEPAPLNRMLWAV